MKITRLKYAIGAAIVISLFAGTASADGKNGREHNGRSPGYHQEYRRHLGPDYRHPTPYRRSQHFGPRYHHGPRYYQGPEHRHGHAHAGYWHPRHPAYRSYVPYGGPALHLSIFDPYFAFGFSTGGRW